MPSASKTLNYDLNQWTSNEYPRRTDFVEDNAKTDAAIKAADDKAESSDLRLTAHQDASTPHVLFNANDGKYYKYGEQISAEGKPQLIFEEVL